MLDALISRARLRDLARLGRVRNRRAAAGGVAASVPSRPRAASPRPGADDLMAATI
jgi:hypothetical protein